MGSLIEISPAQPCSWPDRGSKGCARGRQPNPTFLHRCGPKIIKHMFPSLPLRRPPGCLHHHRMHHVPHWDDCIRAGKLESVWLCVCTCVSPALPFPLTPPRQERTRQVPLPCRRWGRLQLLQLTSSQGARWRSLHFLFMASFPHPHLRERGPAAAGALMQSTRDLPVSAGRLLSSHRLRKLLINSPL